MSTNNTVINNAVRKGASQSAIAKMLLNSNELAKKIEGKSGKNKKRSK